MGWAKEACSKSKGGDGVGGGGRGVGYARFISPRLAAGGRVVRKSAAAAGPGDARRRLNWEETRAGATKEAARRAARQPAPLTRALSGRL